MDPASARRLRAACAAPTGRRSTRPARRLEDPGGAGPVVLALRRAGHREIAIVTLASLAEGVAVVRAFVPGLRRSELL